MVTIPDTSLDRVFAALADPTRRAILHRLERGDARVGELAAPLPMSRAAVSKHLDVLERAGLVHRIAAGRSNICRLDAGPLREALALMERYRRHWEMQLDGLASFLEQESDE